MKMTDRCIKSEVRNAGSGGCVLKKTPEETARMEARLQEMIALEGDRYSVPKNVEPLDQFEIDGKLQTLAYGTGAFRE